MKFLWLISLIILLETSVGHSMFASIYSESRDKLDVNRRTHFVIAGIGKELLLKPQEAALTKALYLKQVFPDEQVVFISNFVDAEDMFNWTGLEFIYYSHSREKHIQNLSVVPVVDYMDRFNNIASVSFFSHSNIQAGMMLSEFYRFGTDQTQQKYAAKLKDNFTNDSYAILFGCNTGWILAPQLSELWNIPVAGSFTGSIFERIGPSNRFIDVDNPKIQYPESNFGVPCTAGSCLRMVVQNAPYRGLWGSLEVDSLNFFKFFCKGMKVLDNCYRGMAYSIIGSVQSYKNLIRNGRVNLFVYRQIVNDFLCSKNWNGRRDLCIEFLNSYDLQTKNFIAERTSFFMLGNIQQLHATFDGHNMKVVPLATEERRGPSIRQYDFVPINKIEKVDTLAREFEAYMSAFTYIKDVVFYPLIKK